jgi:predicted RNA-binding Zn-ribbon protein involved in translation (DUF1610 family)
LTRPPGMSLADYVRELTEPHAHIEYFDLAVRDLDGHLIPRGGQRSGQASVVPALLTQLWENETHTGSAEGGSRHAYSSKPAARLDALDTAARIDIQAHRWITDLGEKPRSLDTVDLIRQLHGLSASASPEARREIARAIRSWWVAARVVTGWDSPAWTPDNTCPQCGERGTLKVRLADAIGMCTNDACRVYWDESTIGLLAEHIRVESAETRRDRPNRGPCFCPWPRPTVPDLAFLCPACGSPRCTHALQRRLIAQLRDMAKGA